MKRLFIDMDGCIAQFHAKQNYLEEMYEEEFFKKLDPYSRIIFALQDFEKKHPEVQMCILSAYPNSPFAKKEKIEWLDKYFPIKNRIFLEAGKNKSEYICDLSKDDYLLDDYTKNLLEWERAGGKGIKVKNELNCKSGVWKGARVDLFDIPADITQQIEEILGIKGSL